MTDHTENAPQGGDIGQFFQELANKYHEESGSVIVVTILGPGESELSLQQGELSPQEILAEMTFALKSMISYMEYQEEEDPR